MTTSQILDLERQHAELTEEYRTTIAQLRPYVKAQREGIEAELRAARRNLPPPVEQVGTLDWGPVWIVAGIVAAIMGVFAALGAR